MGSEFPFKSMFSSVEAASSDFIFPSLVSPFLTFEESPSIEESLESFDDEVFSPPVTLINYPILFNFLNQPHSQAVHHDDVEVMKANQHDVVVQPPPEPPDEHAELTSRLCTSMKVKKEGIRGSWREIGDRERRGAPDS